MSRYAAQCLYNERDAWIAYSQTIAHDDAALGSWACNKYGLTKYNLTNRWFEGHMFHNMNNIKELVNWSQNSKIRTCPPCSALSKQKGRMFLHRVKDIVFWHVRVSYSEFLPFAREVKQAIPTNLWFYHYTRFPELCLGHEASQVPGYCN